MTNKTNNKMTIQLDPMDLLSRYNEHDFMKKVMIEFLQSNPKIVADFITTDLLSELVKERAFDDVNTHVRDRVESYVESSNQYTIDTALDNLAKECVKANKPLLLKQVKLSLTASTVKKTISKQVSSVVAERVSRVLGEVCEGCGEDYDY